MSLINRFKKELFLKILYVGPSRAGKSENLRQVYAATEGQQHEGFLVHRDSKGEAEAKSLFFDFLPLSLGSVADFDVRLHLFSLPGAGKYDAVTRMLMRGADGLVCVLPAIAERVQDNKEVLLSIKGLLEGYGKSWGDVPIVMQYSFTDSARALPVETLRELYNPEGFPEFPAHVNKGKGVLETLRGITHETLHHFKTSQTAAGELGGSSTV